MASAIDLVIDSSAVLAILLGEPEAAAFVNAICAAHHPAVSAATRSELLIVVHARLGKLGVERARQFLDMHAVETVAVDQVLSDLALEAFIHYGKGSHPAGLNFGDCFSYALAKQADAPLLYKGEDFARTDLGVGRA